MTTIKDLGGNALEGGGIDFEGSEYAARNASPLDLMFDGDKMQTAGISSPQCVGGIIGRFPEGTAHATELWVVMLPEGWDITQDYIPSLETEVVRYDNV